jgi:very-short-patch-repair endonuclease
MHDSRDALLARLARHNHGVFTLHEAVACGWTESAIHAQARSGRWVTLHPGVFASATIPLTARTCAAAALSATTPDGALSHATAAGAWGLLAEWPTHTDVTVAHERRVRLGGGVRLHRTRAWEPQDVTALEGQRITSVERTLVDLAADMTRPRRTMAIDEALRRGLTTPEQLVDTVLRLRRPGRQGPMLVLAILLSRPDGTQTHRSSLETLARRVLDAAGIMGGEHNVVVPTPAGAFECDIVWMDERVVVEVDSSYHDRAEQAAFDRHKSSALVMAGFDLIRVRYQVLVRNPKRFTDRVTRALQVGGAEPRPVVGPAA